MAAAYDPEILQKFADRLYSRAAGLPLLYGAFGTGVLGLLGFFYSKFIQYPAFFVVSLVAGAALGGLVGWEKAFSLRLEAQRTLCTLQMERNTRPVAPPAPEASLEAPKLFSSIT
ncbi:MAG: hypothetical protein ACO1OB_02950 [Archangium sp.]